MTALTKKQREDYAEFIFENNVAGFLDWLAASGKVQDVLWCAFDAINEDKNAARVGWMFRHSKWRQKAYDLLETGNRHMWDVLEAYAEDLAGESKLNNCY